MHKAWIIPYSPNSFSTFSSFIPLVPCWVLCFYGVLFNRSFLHRWLVQPRSFLPSPSFSFQCPGGITKISPVHAIETRIASNAISVGRVIRPSRSSHTPPTDCFITRLPFFEIPCPHNTAFQEKAFINYQDPGLQSWRIQMMPPLTSH